MKNNQNPPIVLDTNVLISAILSARSTTAKAVKKALAYYEVYLSQATFEEFLEVIQRKKFTKYLEKRPDERDEFINTLLTFATFIEPTVTITDCQDEKDNKFLEVAVTCKAVYLVSGDKRDLISMNPYQGIEIITVSEFLEKH